MLQHIVSNTHSASLHDNEMKELIDQAVARVSRSESFFGIACDLVQTVLSAPIRLVRMLFSIFKLWLPGIFSSKDQPDAKQVTINKPPKRPPQKFDSALLVDKVLSEKNGYPTIGKGVNEFSLTYLMAINNKRFADINYNNTAVTILLKKYNMLILGTTDFKFRGRRAWEVQNIPMVFFLDITLTKIFDQVCLNLEVDHRLLTVMEDIATLWEEQLKHNNPAQLELLYLAISLKLCLSLQYLANIEVIPKVESNFQFQEALSWQVFRWLDYIVSIYHSYPLDITHPNVRRTKMLLDMMAPGLNSGWERSIELAVEKEYELASKGLSASYLYVFVLLNIIDKLNIFSTETTDESFLQSLSREQEDLTILLNSGKRKGTTEETISTFVYRNMGILKPLLNKYLTPKS